MANVAMNLSVDKDLKIAVKNYITGNRRKGRRDVSELTQALWISYLRSKGVKLPPLLKNGKTAK